MWTQKNGSTNQYEFKELPRSRVFVGCGKRNKNQSQEGQVKQTITKGTIIHYMGIPCELTKDIKVKSGTDLANAQDVLLEAGSRTQSEKFRKQLEDNESDFIS
jgi:hypothetical protein